MLECNSEVLSGMVPANQSVDVRTKGSIEFQFASGTAFDAMMAAIRNYLPQTKVIIGAPWTPLGTQADLTNVRAFNLAKAYEYGLPFLDIDNLVNASNKSIYTGGDNVHPTVAGHYYLAQRIAQKLIPYIA